MPDLTRRFDSYLHNVNADRLKPMVRLWGGKSQMRKDECIELIRSSLADPQKVRAAVAGLEPFERNALALIKQMSGEVEAYALAVGLYTTGVNVPARFSSGYGSSVSAIFDHLYRRSLVFSAYSYDPGYLTGYNGTGAVFSDERLLAQVDQPEVIPLEIPHAEAPPAATTRRPQTVALDILSVMQSIDTLGGLRLTQNGLVRSTEQRKLMREMHWEEDETGIDGFRFPNPSQAWISVLSAAGLLAARQDRLVLAESPDRFAVRPYSDQVAALLAGFVRTEHWNEQWKERWQSYHQKYYSYARLALVLALRSLPAQGMGWFGLADLDKALFERVGEHFSLDFIPSRPYSFRKTSEQLRKEEAEWRAQLRANWLKRERKWVEQAFTTWLYLLGMVELGIERGNLVSFRLTELGRAVLYPDLAAEPELPQEELPCPWVVQPNFEVIVYLDRTNPSRLAFLEKHAERAQAQQHTAVYRLTRDSVYRALENGSSADTLLTGLRAGSEADLPQNVCIEIREWAALRERIALHRRGRLLEFPGPATRHAAQAQGVQGVPLGERFLLLPDLPPGQNAGDNGSGLEFKRVDYSQPLPRCCSIKESGEIKLKTDHPDLLIEAQLDRWAERQPGSEWRLSQASVAAAVARGARIQELLELLASRLTNALPALLRVALLAWAGNRPAAELATVSLLRCRDPEVFRAIAASKALKPYLLGQIAPDLLLVDRSQLEALKERLAWAGLNVDDDLNRVR